MTSLSRGLVRIQLDITLDEAPSRVGPSRDIVSELEARAVDSVRWLDGVERVASTGQRRDVPRESRNENE